MATILAVFGILGSILGIFEYLITIKEKINRATDSLRLPKELDFYFLSFFALVAAAAGGLLWNFVCSFFGSECPFVGGTGSEPHGRLAILWPITTLSVTVITLLILNWKYRFMKVKDQALCYLAFLIGTIIGSLLFYDLPLIGVSGFRNYFDAIHAPFLEKEFALVGLWSSSIAFFGFLALGLMKIKLSSERSGIRLIVLPILEQMILCIGLTTFAVAFCLLALPSEPRFETARGIIAGLALRMSVFFGLLMAHVPLEGVLPAYIRHLLRVKIFILRQPKSK